MAAAVFVVHIVDTFWLVAPSFHTRVSWMDFATFIGLGGLWLATFFFALDRLGSAM